jgi:hypothetical protein
LFLLWYVFLYFAKRIPDPIDGWFHLKGSEEKNGAEQKKRAAILFFFRLEVKYCVIKSKRTLGSHSVFPHLRPSLSERQAKHEKYRLAHFRSPLALVHSSEPTQRISLLPKRDKTENNKKNTFRVFFWSIH